MSEESQQEIDWEEQDERAGLCGKVTFKARGKNAFYLVHQMPNYGDWMAEEVRYGSLSPYRTRFFHTKEQAQEWAEDRIRNKQDDFI